ncbi:hypothetical protein [Streptomyces sp. NBC_00829]|uniref:hypothetical protein n=1 Tax=Streptomyces sp. NBC_00829 TaxID=2903679 RepID=UPI00386A341D|nr:hypothetical protein OG293_04815 [Streptomyces sp. NBC_00829]
MSGAGITARNADRILHLTGARDLHFSARASQDGPARHRNHRPAMGASPRFDEYVRRTTSRALIHEVIRAVRGPAAET